MAAGAPAPKATGLAPSPAQKAKAVAAGKAKAKQAAKEQQKQLAAAALIEQEIADAKMKKATAPPEGGAPGQGVTEEAADAKVNADVETVPHLVGTPDQVVTEATPAGRRAPGPVGKSVTPRTSPKRALSGGGDEREPKKKRRHSGGDASEVREKGRRRRRSSGHDEARHMCQV